MKVSKIKINGIENPIGFAYDTIRCSWIVSNTKAKKTEFAKIEVSKEEILQHRNFYNANYKRAKAHFIYVSGGKEELVKPQFTYYGFRYVRVTGWEGDFNKDDFT